MIKRSKDFELDFDDELMFEEEDFYEGNDFGFVDRKKFRKVFVAS